jgi:hypothetical protein
LVGALLPDGDGLLPGPVAWVDTALELPAGWTGGTVDAAATDELTGRTRRLPAAGTVPVAKLLDELPMALLATGAPAP